MFFFFKQKTAYEMRISDWSSDVCSSDLCSSPTWPTPSPPSSARSSSAEPVAPLPSAAQRPARPAPPTTGATPGSSGSPRHWPHPCGWASPRWGPTAGRCACSRPPPRSAPPPPRPPRPPGPGSWPGRGPHSPRPTSPRRPPHRRAHPPPLPPTPPPDGWGDACVGGFTPALATSVWVGFPEVGPGGRQVRMQPPATPIRVTGGSYPAAIWQRFMSRALAEQPSTDFHPPPTTTTTTAPPSSTPTTRAPRPSEAVPDVIGQGRESATTALSAAGFAVRVVPATEGPQLDTVVAQSPLPGHKAPRGSTVVIEVVGA